MRTTLSNTVIRGRNAAAKHFLGRLDLLRSSYMASPYTRYEFGELDCPESHPGLSGWTVLTRTASADARSRSPGSPACDVTSKFASQEVITA